jgi:hypothetical protein
MQISDKITGGTAEFKNTGTLGDTHAEIIQNAPVVKPVSVVILPAVTGNVVVKGSQVIG